MLENCIKRVEEAIDSFPEGRLRVVQTNRPQYFYIQEKGDTKGAYIKKNQRFLAQQLAQKDYYERLLHEMKNELNILKRFGKRYDGNCLMEVYDKMVLDRKQLIKPVFVSDAEYAKRWQEEPDEYNPYHPEELKYNTEREEKVRSKSEKMIADMYNELGIPYKYEKPLTLSNGVTKYPDFTLLKVSSRQEVYHEHLGMLDDDEYRDRTLKKLREYEQNGIILGKNLIISYETSNVPFDVDLLRKNIISIINE